MKQLTRQEIETLTESKGLTRSEFLTRIGNCKTAYEEIKKCLSVCEENGDRHEFSILETRKETI